MLAGIKGKVLGCQDGRLLLEVGSFSIEVLVPHSFSPRPQAEIKLFTSLFIREENLALYGFPSFAEKKFFGLALTVPGVGPKLALSLLSGMPLSELARQLESGNTKALEKIPGIGKKMAQRLVGDLRGKMAGFLISGEDTKGQAAGILIDLGLEPVAAWEAIEGIKGENHSVNDLVNLSLKKLGEKEK